MKHFTYLFLFIFSLFSFQAYGQWIEDPSQNNPISTDPATSGDVASVTDGHGGAIIFFTKTNNVYSYYYDIYAQRIDATGKLLWQKDGVLVNKTDMQSSSFIVTEDGTGGAIVAWQSTGTWSSYDIAAQKIDGQGIVKWSSQGVVVCNAPRYQSPTSIVGDGNGGAVITWWDDRKSQQAGGGYGGGVTPPADTDVYAQHLDAGGSSTWQSNGIPICDEAHNQSDLRVEKSGNKYFFVWGDPRNNKQPVDYAPYTDIYLQIVDAQGNLQLVKNGISLTNTTGFILPITILSDYNGGVIIFWSTIYPQSGYYYAQRIDPSGKKLWGANGISLNTTPLSGFSFASRAFNGISYSMTDSKAGTINISKLGIDGSTLWSAQPITVSDPGVVSLLSCGNGETIVTWSDFGGDETDPTPSYMKDYRIYAQKFSNMGGPIWNGTSIPVSTAAHARFGAQLIDDNAGGAIAVWTDGRDYTSGNFPDNGHADVYAAHISATGNGIKVTPGNLKMCPLVKAINLNSNTTSVYIYNADSTIVTQNDSGAGPNERKIHTYNKNHQLVKLEFFDSNGATPSFWYLYEYDQYGLLSKESYYTNDFLSYPNGNIELTLYTNDINTGRRILGKSWYYSGTLTSDLFYTSYIYSADGNLKASKIVREASVPGGIQERTLSVTNYSYDYQHTHLDKLNELLVEDYSFYLPANIPVKNAITTVATQNYDWSTGSSKLSTFEKYEYQYSYGNNNLPGSVKIQYASYVLPSDTTACASCTKASYQLDLTYACQQVPVPSSGLSVYTSNRSGDKDSYVSVPVKTNQFNKILSGQLSLSWNTSKAQYVGVEQFGLSGLGINSFGTNATNKGILSFSWSSPSLQPVTVTDSTILFAVKFKLIGNYGDTTHINIVSKPAAIEFIDDAYAAIATTVSSGVLKINSTVNLNGIVKYANMEPVQNVSIAIDGGISQVLATDSKGQYVLDVTPGKSYTITPSKPNDPQALNGIDVQDVASIRRHILGTQLLSPYQVIAADVNKSSSVTTLDLILVQALVLGVKDNFPNNAQWTFVPADFQFADNANPFPYDENKTLTPASSATTDFVGIKLGDVNNSRDNSQSNREQTASVTFEMGLPVSVDEDEIEVPVRVYGFNDIAAYQFTVEWDTDQLQYKGTKNNGIAGAFGEQQIGKGKLTTLWDETNGKSQTLSDGSTLFSLRFQKQTADSTNTMRIERTSLTPAKVYGSSLNALGFVIQKEDGLPIAFEATAYPNPFTTSTQLRVRLPEAGMVAIEIYTSAGDRLSEVVTECPAGTNTISLNGKEVKENTLSDGLYLLKVTYKNGYKTIKVIKH